MGRRSLEKQGIGRNIGWRMICPGSWLGEWVGGMRMGRMRMVVGIGKLGLGSVG